MTDKDIEAINNLILEAVIHGADISGSYNQNRDGLICAMDYFMETYDLYDKYKIDEVDVKKADGVELYLNGTWNVPQFVEK